MSDLKKLLFIPIIIFALEQVAAQPVVYVRQGSNGNGTSWNAAFGDLQSALLNVQSGQEIWVAAGTYYPGRGNDRKMVFRIRNDVKLYGGFSGQEKSRQERDWYKNLTILSGEIGAAGSADNIYTILYTKNVSPNTTVDGFVITGASSSGTSDLGSMERCGGAWYNDGSGGESSPTISNCLFIDNFAREGAGLYNYANAGICRPKLIDCQFISNKAHLEGAAIFNDGRNGKANPNISGCYFLENTSNYGAVMRNLADNGESVAQITNSVFEANVSYVREIIYNGPQASDKCKAVLQACHFFNNEASMGNTGNNTSNFTKRQGYRREGEIKYLIY